MSGLVALSLLPAAVSLLSAKLIAHPFTKHPRRADLSCTSFINATLFALQSATLQSAKLIASIAQAPLVAHTLTSIAYALTQAALLGLIATTEAPHAVQLAARVCSQGLIAKTRVQDAISCADFSSVRSKENRVSTVNKFLFVKKNANDTTNSDFLLNQVTT